MEMIPAVITLDSTWFIKVLSSEGFTVGWWSLSLGFVPFFVTSCGGNF